MKKKKSNGLKGKNTRVGEIKQSALGFCEKNLNAEFCGYVLKLCDTVGSNRKINITKGKKEIWAASIIYVISHLNSLFDKENENFLTPGIICTFFNTKKSTVGSKAAHIEDICNISEESYEYCSKKIIELTPEIQPSEVKTPEIQTPAVKIPENVIPKDPIEISKLIIKPTGGKVSYELKKLGTEQRTNFKFKRMEKRAKVIKKTKEKKRKRKYRQQIIFDEF